MPMHLDHYQLSTRNIYSTAQTLREQTGLGFYDGGYFSTGGIANKIFPLGGGTYLEVEGVVDAGAVATEAGAKTFYDRSADGECFSLVSMRVDTLDELKAIADRFGTVLAKSPVTRIRPNGPPVMAYSTPPGTHTGHDASGKEVKDPTRIGRVNWYCHEDRLYMHPAGQPVFNWPGLVEPQGISFLEVGGTEQQMTDWLGIPASQFPYRYNGNAHGLYAIGVKTDKGEVVIRRSWRD